MYPDPITPRSHPDQLQSVAYDPFGLMPEALPAHPRVFLTGERLGQARRNIESCEWAKRSFERLVANCREPAEIPAELPVPADPKINSSVLGAARRNALAALLTGEAAFRGRALDCFRAIARAYARWPVKPGGNRAGSYSLDEARFSMNLGQTYDLLAAGGLGAEDDALFRAAVRAAYETTDIPLHPTCGNHNSWMLAGRTACASALGDLQGIHDVLYGFDRGGTWRYGWLHQLRHDILSDGLHWERTMGYHYYALMGMTEGVQALANIGSDLWHAQLPPLWQDDGHDLHRAYGPRGVKCFKAAFDAPLLHAFPNLDLPMLGDSGLGNLRGVWIWGIIYNLAYEAYGDPAHAWLLSRMESEHASREFAGVPMPLQTKAGDLDFARLADAVSPAGSPPSGQSRPISISGVLDRGCSLFPANGSALLRRKLFDPQAPAAFLFWGPHSAGHQAPGALHADWFAAGRTLTEATCGAAYNDDFVNWERTTIAHNTVTVDQSPMFPYDFETKAYYECDRWRDTISDGELLLFQPEGRFAAVRARNENVYRGVCLDRTVVVADGFILDVYRALSDAEHEYDWAMHVLGRPQLPAGSRKIDLGQRRGYCKLTDARVIRSPGREAALEWTTPAGATRARLLPPAGASIIVASDPPAPEKALGALASAQPRHALIVRARASRAVFVSLWTASPDADVPLRALSAEPDGDVVVRTGRGRSSSTWRFPFEGRSLKVRRS